MNTRWKAICPLLLVVAFDAMSLRAQIIEAIGYGTGDNIEQAMVAAQGDAVLNANAKAVFKTEADGRKLAKDVGVISNEVYIVESTLLERGESFDGTYARVKLKVSKSEVPGRKNGVTEILGEGVAKTREDAVRSALGNILIQAGGKITVFMESRNDELEQDETRISGSGFIRSFKELSVVEEDGRFRAKVSATVRPYSQEEDSSVAGTRTSGVASGSDIGLVIAEARLNAILSCGAGCKYAVVFKNGLDFSACLERSITGVRSGLEAVINESDRNITVSVNGVARSANSMFGEKRPIYTGFGFADNDEAAFAIARGDAVLSRESVVAARSTVLIDKESHSSMLLTGRAFVAGVNVVSRIGDCVAVCADLGEDSSDVFRNGPLESEADGEGDSLSAAVAKAKFGAIINSGLMMDAKMRYEDGVLKECETHGESTDSIRGNKVEISNDAGRWRATATVVAGGELDRQRNQPHDTTGYGFDSDARAAFALARADAVLSHNSIARKESSFKLGGKPQESVKLTGRSFIMTKSPVAIDGGVSVVAVVGKEAETVYGENHDGIRASATGATMSAAIARAKFDAIMNSGIALDASMRYEDGVLRECEASGETSTTIDRCVINLESAGGVNRATASIVIGEGANQTLRRPETTTGYGFAPDRATAFALARIDAVLNSRTTVRKKNFFKLGGLVRDSAAVSGKSFVGTARTSPIENGVVLESLVGDTASEVWPNGVFTVNGIGVGKNEEEAIAAARCDAVYKSGIMIDAEAEYSDGEMRTVKADCNCKANICGLSVVSLKRESDQCHAEVKIQISNGEHVSRPELVKVVGIGVAPTLLKARSAARANAVLNAKSTMTQEYIFRNGKLSTGDCSFSGESCFVDDSLQIEKQGKDYVVTSEVSLGDGNRELPDGEESVRVKGFGSSAKEAIKDARQNAVDKVFGRKMSVTTSGTHFVNLHIVESAEEDGYVRSETVVRKSKNDFGWSVEMDAVVARRVKGWGWLKALIVFLILGVIMYALKEKSMALYVIAGICFCLSMFATGHWVVGILLVLCFIGGFQEGN